MLKFIICIKITLFEKHMQNVVDVAKQQKIIGNAQSRHSYYSVVARQPSLDGLCYKLIYISKNEKK